MLTSLTPKLNYNKQVYADDIRIYNHYIKLFKSPVILESSIGIPINIEGTDVECNNKIVDICNYLDDYFKEFTKIELHHEHYTYQPDDNLFITNESSSVYAFEEAKILFNVITGKNNVLFRIFAQEHNHQYDYISNTIQKIVNAPLFKFKPKESICNIIVRRNNTFSLREFELPKVTFDIMNYNDDIIEVSDHIDNSLRTTSKGIVLLHGEMGTGKTSYLRSLMGMKIDKEIIYVPPDMISYLSSPEFIEFLVNQCSDSIIIIEDAENILQTRESGGNQAVSNMLNISDGILGDILKLQFVCTFNSSLDMIDPALRRPGRLIAEYEFKKLTVKKTTELIKKLYNVEYTENKEKTLAEIYNYSKVLYKTKEHKKGIGFINND